MLNNRSAGARGVASSRRDLSPRRVRVRSGHGTTDDQDLLRELVPLTNRLPPRRPDKSHAGTDRRRRAAALGTILSPSGPGETPATPARSPPASAPSSATPTPKPSPGSSTPKSTAPAPRSRTTSPPSPRRADNHRRRVFPTGCATPTHRGGSMKSPSATAGPHAGLVVAGSVLAFYIDGLVERRRTDKVADTNTGHIAAIGALASVQTFVNHPRSSGTPSPHLTRQPEGQACRTFESEMIAPSRPGSIAKLAPEKFTLPRKIADPKFAAALNAAPLNRASELNVVSVNRATLLKAASSKSATLQNFTNPKSTRPPNTACPNSAAPAKVAPSNSTRPLNIADMNHAASTNLTPLKTHR